ncbi:MAG: hypothetical protein KAS07_04035, partial [Candidatus Pacebacteria bacterium]|nr:hypothetical protein [Candidatus Paceibacterota bacterium]
MRYVCVCAIQVIIDMAMKPRRREDGEKSDLGQYSPSLEKDLCKCKHFCTQKAPLGAFCLLGRNQIRKQIVDNISLPNICFLLYYMTWNRREISK